MADRSIASRPSLEQVVAIVDYMEKHPPLALGQLRGLEGREESKKLWLGLTRIVNGITGPTRPMKSWIKYWADKKSSVRSKVLSAGGDPDNLCSNLEKKIWDLFLAEDQGKQHGRSRNVKVESQIPEEPFLNDDSRDQDIPEVEDHTEEIEFEEPPLNYEQRQVNLMEKLVKVMSAQAAAMTQIAHATQLNSQAMGRLADSALLQARAVERLSASLESIGASSVGVRAAVADIDNTMKRFYTNHT